jgi:hypothetical protein
MVVNRMVSSHEFPVMRTSCSGGSEGEGGSTPDEVPLQDKLLDQFHQHSNLGLMISDCDGHLL